MIGASGRAGKTQPVDNYWSGPAGYNATAPVTGVDVEIDQYVDPILRYTATCCIIVQLADIHEHIRTTAEMLLQRIEYFRSAVVTRNLNLGPVMQCRDVPHEMAGSVIAEICR